MKLVYLIFCGFFSWLGNALLFLLPSEDSYVEFLSINQKVRFVPQKSGADLASSARRGAGFPWGGA